MEKLYIYRYPKYKNITGKDLFLIDEALFLDLTEAEMTKSEKLYKFKDEEMVDEYLSCEDYSHIDKDCLDFYKKHYRPSNSYIYLFGKMDIEEKLAYLDREYLSKYDAQTFDNEIKHQPSQHRTIRKEEYYPV